MIALERLMMLSLGELDDAEAEVVEEHVLACGGCASKLEHLLRIGSAVRALVGAGEMQFFASAATIEELERAGLVTRAYRLAPGETAACTATAEDIYIAGFLSADLTAVSRVDVVQNFPGGRQRRFEDVPFDAARGIVAMVHRGAHLRTLPSAKGVTEVFAVEHSGERKLGEYVFDHTAAHSGDGH